MIGELERRIKEEIQHAEKSLNEDLDEFGIVGNGFWEFVEKDILKHIKKAGEEFPMRKVLLAIPIMKGSNISTEEKWVKTSDADKAYNWFLEYFGDKNER